MDETAANLHRYLRDARATLVSKLDGLSEYDVRRPLVPSGTNLLGLVKHLVGIEVGYLGESVGRPAPFRIPWDEDGSVWENGDMWATPDQSREYLVEGGVFTPDVIQTWIDFKREHEIDPLRLRPHPYEYALYYDV